MKELKEQIKAGRIQGAYLFYGEEGFLIRTYTERIRRALMEEADEIMNYSVMDSPHTTEEIRDNLQTLPFMVEKRLVVIKNSGAFQPGDEFPELSRCLEETKEPAVVIFIEEKVDKRARLYKYLDKEGKIVQFQQQTPADLARWIRREAARSGKELSDETARFFIAYVGRDMTHILEEWEKLQALTAERTVITKKDIQEVCTINIEENIFAITDRIADKKGDGAMKIFAELIAANTPPQRIFYMMVRQFRQLMRAAVMTAEGKRGAEVARALGIPTYPAELCVRQSRKFGQKKLQEILWNLLEMDASTKNGNLDAMDACLLVILQYAA